MSQVISVELLELAAEMGVNVSTNMTEDDVRRRILNSKIMPKWLIERARAEGAAIRSGCTYETARTALGEVIVRKSGFRAGMVVLLKGVETKIIGIRYGGQIILGKAANGRDGWELVEDATTVYVTALDHATVIYDPPNF